MSQEPHIGKKMVNLKISGGSTQKVSKKMERACERRGKGWMSKVRAGNQGGRGEQSMARNWSLKTKVAEGKMPVGYPADFFFTRKYFNKFCNFVVLQHKTPILL